MTFLLALILVALAYMAGRAVGYSLGKVDGYRMGETDGRQQGIATGKKLYTPAKKVATKKVVKKK